MTGTCCDYASHDPGDTCRYDGCATCGGPYTFGPSRFRECGTCSEAEDEPAAGPRDLSGLSSPVWDGRPF